MLNNLVSEKLTRDNLKVWTNIIIRFYKIDRYYIENEEVFSTFPSWLKIPTSTESITIFRRFIMELVTP